MKAWALFGVGLLLLCSLAKADDEAVLQQQRNDLEQVWRTEMDGCLEKFAVTHCQDLATKRYREQDKQLSQRLIDLHQKQRLQRALDKRNELQQREDDFEQELLKRSHSKLASPQVLVQANSAVQSGIKHLFVPQKVPITLSGVEEARVAYERKLALVYERRMARDKRLADVGGYQQFLPTP